MGIKRTNVFCTSDELVDINSRIREALNTPVIRLSCSSEDFATSAYNSVRKFINDKAVKGAKLDFAEDGFSHGIDVKTGEYLAWVPETGGAAAVVPLDKTCRRK